MKKHYRKENNCLNCRTTLDGKFCHNCGQENLQIKESFGHMMTHAVADYFHFDHQFFHTLGPLFLKPGKLTNEYMAGKRVQYLHPVKMYIFISIIFFLLFFQGNHELIKVDRHKGDKLTKEQQSKIADYTTGYIPVSTAKKKEIKDKMLAEMAAEAKKDSIAKSKDTTAKDEEIDEDEAFNEGITSLAGTKGKKYNDYETYLAAQEKLPESQRDNIFERYFEKKNIAWRQNGKNSKEALMEGIKHNTPKMMFVLLPLFALILKLTFWRSRKFYVEHLIYSFHLHCFLFLFLAITMLIIKIAPGLYDYINFAAFLVIIWYIYRSLRVVYQRSRFRTITKMMGMGLSYFFAFVVIMITVIAITALTSV